jgi:hypothetical protein
MHKKFKIKNFIYFILFTFSLFLSYLVGLLFYDSTTGLDYSKYFLNVRFFMGESVQLGDGNGSIYFYLISKAVSSNIFGIESQNLSIHINNAIQSVNFVLYIIGLIGLFLIFKNRNTSNLDLLLSFTILSFLPMAFYFRLTMKPEVMGFTLLPWVIYFFESYFNQKTMLNRAMLTVILSILLTIKGSITGMSLIILVYLYRKKLYQNKDTRITLLTTGIISSLLLYVNYMITEFWVFSNNSSDLTNPERWNNTATIRFYTKIDFKNLLENPFQYVHSDSFFSITLLDTLSDYFGFFWKHEERTNYISFDRVKFTNNFLIQEYLPQYISIIFTLSFYLFVLTALYKKIEFSEFLIMPVIGLLILIINSFGFPNKNFDPNTGDLFKAHYYSYLFTISFLTLLIICAINLDTKKYLLLFFIPLFLLSMGFPKNISAETEAALYEKMNISEVCLLFKYLDKVDCSK